MRQPRHGQSRKGSSGKTAKRTRTEATEPGKKGVSPETWETVVRLAISSIEPVSKLIEAISRLH